MRCANAFFFAFFHLHIPMHMAIIPPRNPVERAKCPPQGRGQIAKRKDRTMPHVISDDCTMCGACAEECPVDAISEGDPKYKIDPDECTDCGACAEVCPVDAISEAD